MFDFTKKHDYLVGIDSDGCAFDTMELKHKECFIPNIINHYGLQGVSKYAREAAEFVNLYSKSRGINRFPALIEALEWLRRRPEVAARGIEVRIPASLVAWIKKETKQANPALAAAAEATGDADLKQALAWSKAVNETIAGVVRGVPPFPLVRECLEKLRGKADVLVVSATPNEALHREWQEHGLDGFVAAICGQEIGTKSETLGVASQYAANHTLMVGDAPGDYKAAVANRALFFPINPGSEETSWRRLYEEGLDRFFAGTFAGACQERLLAEFDKCLPERPPWPVVEEVGGRQ
ncbi:MAG: HAD family hydrolase [Planctomycetia bacterium]|nr:HAD family hydrolase [Planctomycetia bacterium]